MATRATTRKDSSVDDEFLHQLYRGGELLAAGKVIEAKDYLEKAHKLQPKNEKGQNLLGLTYFKLGLFDRASEIYEALVRENPADPTLRVNLGLVYLKTNALQRAIREFETATDLSPEHQKAQNYLGLALAQAGEYGRAREHFLLAGSTAMAEKMSRAIAGEGFEKPEAKSPAKEKGFAEIEGSEVVAERGGHPVAAAQAQLPPEQPPAQVIEAPPEAVEPPASAEVQIDVSEGEPPVGEAAAAGSQAPAGQLGALGQDDWGAQFGLDGSQQGEAPQEAAYAQSFEAQAAVPPDSGADLEVSVEEPVAAAPVPMVEEITVDEGGATLPPEATAPSAGELPTLELTAQGDDAAFSEESMSAPPPAEPRSAGARAARVEEPVGEDDPAADLLARAEGRLTPPDLSEAARMPEAAEPVTLKVPVHHFGRPDAAAPAALPSPPALSLVPPAPSTTGVHAPPLMELGQSLELFPEPVAGPFAIREGAVGIVVQGEVLTRTVGLVAISGKVELVAEMKRSRGRGSDKPFGEGEQAVHRATGSGLLVVEPLGEHFTSIDLGDESAYFREERVFAFEEPVMFENGRVPSEVPPDLDLVHLRGKGRVLLRLPGTLRTLTVKMERAVTIPLGHLVGWYGNLTPRMVPLGKDLKGRPARAGVELSGEGFALVAVAVK